MPWNTTSLENGSYLLTAVARDASGNDASASITVTVANDAGAPTVSLTSPAPGTTASGTVALAATASDDVGIASVRFFVDGVAVGDADVEAPHEVAW